MVNTLGPSFLLDFIPTTMDLITMLVEQRVLLEMVYDVV